MGSTFEVGLVKPKGILLFFLRGFLSPRNSSILFRVFRPFIVKLNHPDSICVITRIMSLKDTTLELKRWMRRADKLSDYLDYYIQDLGQNPEDYKGSIEEYWEIQQKISEVQKKLSTIMTHTRREPLLNYWFSS